MRWRYFFEKRMIGMDIQEDVIYLATACIYKNQTTIKQCHKLSLKSGTMAQQKIENWHALKETLNQAILEKYIKKNDLTALALPFSLIKMKQCQLITANESVDVEFEIKNKILKEEAVDQAFDFKTLSEHQDKVDILYATAPCEYVQQCNRVFESLKLPLCKIDIDILAIWRTLSHFFPLFNDGRLTALIYPYTSQFLFFVYQDDRIILNQIWQKTNDNYYIENKLIAYQKAFPHQKIERLILATYYNLTSVDNIDEVYTLSDLHIQLPNAVKDSSWIAIGMCLGVNLW